MDKTYISQGKLLFRLSGVPCRCKMPPAIAKLRPQLKSWLNFVSNCATYSLRWPWIKHFSFLWFCSPSCKMRILKLVLHQFSEHLRSSTVWVKNYEGLKRKVHSLASTKGMHRSNFMHFLCNQIWLHFIYLKNWKKLGRNLF